MPTGLDNIVECILDEAKSSRSDLLAKARVKADEILKEAKLEADNLSKTQAMRVDEEILKLKSKAESLAKVKFRDGIAFAKSDIINKIIKKAKEKISNLPDEEYFEVILNICKPYLRKGEKCEIVFSNKDLKRMPKGFENKILSLGKGCEVAVKISKEVLKNSNGGVILRYHDVDENCTLDCIFSEKYSALVDLLNKFLFKEEV